MKKWTTPEDPHVRLTAGLHMHVYTCVCYIHTERGRGRDRETGRDRDRERAQSNPLFSVHRTVMDLKRVLDLGVEQDTNCLKMCTFYTWRREWPDEQSPLGDAISPSHPRPVKAVFAHFGPMERECKWRVTLSGDCQGQAVLSTSSFLLKRHVPDQKKRIALLWFLGGKKKNKA